jgi:hypothetical protein
MAKLYLFGIGGTGSRVIKSLAMLLAAGVKLENINTVVPIIIDPDIANGDLTRTNDILTLYKTIRDKVAQPDDFFYQELTPVGQLANNNANDRNFRLNLDIQNDTFNNYIQYNTKEDNNKHFVDLLYSSTNLNLDLKVGFKGNPNIGAVVLNQFERSNAFRTFANTFAQGDIIFIINSIFGGTGAAGFPLLLKNLRGNENLPNHQQIKNARIGAITYLPYFRLDKQDEINHESFIERAKNAIIYYNRTIINQKQINTLYFIGDGGSDNIQSYSVGGSNQKNSANFLELAGTLAILDFCQNLNQNNHTTIKEFGIVRNADYLSFGDLSDTQRQLIEEPLSKFWLFTKYLENPKGLEKGLKFSRWTKSDIKLVSRQKQSPCDDAYFNNPEYINDVKNFTTYFGEWIEEFSEKYPKFSPFQGEIPDELFKQIDLHNCLNIDDLKLRSPLDKENKPTHIHTTLIKLFGRSTKEAYHHKKIMSEKVIRKNEDGNAKVFRLHEGQAGQGWFTTNPIDPKELEKVETDGKFVANSIPSPFARLDLFKSAFQWINHKISNVVGQQNLADNEKRRKIEEICKADTAYNNLISEVFDIAELFYRSQSLRDKIKIIAWNPRERINALINAQNEKHKHFAETLKLFWEQDSVQNGNLYNFELFNLNPNQPQNNPYKLFFVVNRNENRVIGGTSPITLFFSAPNASSAIGDIRINNRRPIIDFRPLHKRDPELILYIYAFTRQRDDFAARFPEVFDYLRYIREYCLQENLMGLVNRLNAESISRYNPCSVTDNPNEHCDVLGFRIGVEKSIFSEKIIKLPYPIDSQYFKTCTPSNANQQGFDYYLIPLSADFVNAHGIENIGNISIENLAAGGTQVEFQLNGVKYSKTYHRDDIIQPHIHLAILPFLKHQNPISYYTIGVLNDRKNRNEKNGNEKNGNENLSLTFFGNNAPINVEAPVVRNNGQGGTASMYYKVSAFDYIQIEIGDAKGLVIPKFQQAGGYQALSFAVDVGTTNTHIEYRVGQDMTTAFEVNQNQPLWQSLMRRDNIDNIPNINVIKAVLETFDKEMIPYTIGGNDNNAPKFPLRTAIVFNLNYAIDEHYKLFQHINNYLLYDRRIVPPYLTPDTQIKWSNYQADNQKSKVKAYIEYLLTVIYYKTLLLGGNPQNTKIYWFYPVSMTTFEQQTYTQLWQQAYQRVFGANNFANLISIPESVAPYLYYRTTEIIGRSLLIDIGGGTSDIAVFTQQGREQAAVPDFISSFKFAGNAIFGNGYFADNVNNNGWVRSFKTEENRKIIGDGYADISWNTGNSVDFSNFLFSLENLGIFNYSEKIRNHPRLKLTILVFYASIAFYSAKLLNKSKIEIPKNILLSGNASKTARILDASQNCQHISSLFRYIFQRVYRQESQEIKINFRIADTPKEITCRGALLAGLDKNNNNIAVKFWLGGSQNRWAEAVDRNDVNQLPTYNQITKPEKDDICNSISEFYQILDNYGKANNLNNIFGISQDAYEKFMEIRDEQITDYLERYIGNMRNNHIEETLFFAPLVGILHRLANELSQMQ